MVSQRMSDQDFQEYSDAHLLHEVGMLLDTFYLLAKKVKVRDTVGQEIPCIPVALLESFLVHARVLISFLYDTRLQSDDVSAKGFCTGDDSKWVVKQVDESLNGSYTRINKKLAHLTKTRAEREPEEGMWGCDEIAEKLIDRLREFLDCVPESRLGPRFREYIATAMGPAGQGRLVFPSTVISTAGSAGAATLAVRAWYNPGQ